MWCSEVSSNGLGSLLVSLQLADSAFPIGLYTMSHGLEGFQQSGLLGDTDVTSLLADVLVHVVGPGDATALALAHAAAPDLDRVLAVDRLLFASKLNAELRTASVRSGRQLIGLAVDLFDDPALGAYAALVRAKEAPGCQAVVSALCHAVAGVPVTPAVAADVFAFASSFVGAALRLR